MISMRLIIHKVVVKKEDFPCFFGKEWGDLDKDWKLGNIGLMIIKKVF
jgi:hypothetical protein